MKPVFINKIAFHFQSPVIFGFVFLLTPFCTNAQHTILNKYGLWVINTPAQLKKTVKQRPGKVMTDLKKHIPTLVVDLRYCGKDNFMNQPLYPPITSTYLRRVAADSLKKVQQELNTKGLGLKIFDAYRPYSITEKMWEPVKDDRYAADPKKGSGHNRGIAVDLAVINLQTMQELDMGTGFDNFSDTAHHAFINLPEEVLENRMMLKTLMERYGFKALDTEWWHYYLLNAKEFELLDISFSELKKIKLK
jgi:zinc D-Ala-D-Ala dipeptidase